MSLCISFDAPGSRRFLFGDPLAGVAASALRVLEDEVTLMRTGCLFVLGLLVFLGWLVSSELGTNSDSEPDGSGLDDECVLEFEFRRCDLRGFESWSGVSGTAMTCLSLGDWPSATLGLEGLSAGMASAEFLEARRTRVLDFLKRNEEWRLGRGGLGGMGWSSQEVVGRCCLGGRP